MRYWGPERHQERDLFIYFFKNPQVLMDMYNDLKQRVEAAKINSS